MAVNPPARPSALSRLGTLLNAAWLRPVLFLVFLVVLWDVTIRVFRIPPYQIPKPEDVLVTLWNDWPQLLRQAIPTTIATVEGFCSPPCSASPPRC